MARNVKRDRFDETRSMPRVAGHKRRSIGVGVFPEEAEFLNKKAATMGLKGWSRSKLIQWALWQQWYLPTPDPKPNGRKKRGGR